MKNTTEFRYKFLENRDETGRFYIYSFRTGKTYFVEPIGPDRPADWGSYNPSTGKIENKKGFDKFQNLFYLGGPLLVWDLSPVHFLELDCC
jgi:hypothetical protein